MKKHCRLMIILVSLFLLTSCAVAGRNFSSAGVAQIKLGITSQEEIRSLFGPPWRKGVEDGHPTWTYGYYRYGMFSSPQTADLVVRFDQNGKVYSYSYSSTD